MPSVVLVAGMAKHLPHIENADVIGVDHGAWICLKEQVAMTAAIGDFDSVSEEELKKIQEKTNLVKLPTHKDETDSEWAVLYALKQGYDDIILYGALGGRIDHEMANLYMLMHRDYPLTLMDERNRIRVLHKGSYKIKKEYKYLSFLALEDCCISESGVAYPIDHRRWTTKDILGISNEILEDAAHITIHEGRVLMMETNDV